MAKLGQTRALGIARDTGFEADRAKLVGAAAGRAGKGGHGGVFSVLNFIPRANCGFRAQSLASSESGIWSLPVDADEMIAKARSAIRSRRSFGFELARFIFVGIYKLSGWKVHDAMPPDRRMVIIAAPHTSNWDLLTMLAVTLYYRVPVRWMGKKSLGTGPFGWIMRWWGLLPVDRKQSTSVVDQVAQAYAAADELHVVIAPEGTRSDVTAWKTGFHSIAVAAGVPIALGFIDSDLKIAGAGGPYRPTGNYPADMAAIGDFYAARLKNYSVPQPGPETDD